MPTLALSMIVRNAAELLPACLASARGSVDEMVLADTGSEDHTIEVAQQHGARVVSIGWNNDFAEARNRALAEIKSDWVLVLDADEQLDPAAGRVLPGLVGDAAVAGYQVTIRNYVLSLEDRIWDRAAKANDSLLPAALACPGYVDHENVRLFRRHPAVYFTGRVHESVGPSIEKSRGKLAPATFCIHHLGLAADPETRARKNILYRELGHQKLQDTPNNAQAHLEVGLVEMDNFGNLQEALARFADAARLKPGWGMAWFFEGVALLKLDRFAEALECFRQAERRGHTTALLAEIKGDAHYNLGQYAEARASYEVALRRERGNPLFESKLGLAVVRDGQVEKGLRLIEHAVLSKPGIGELHDRLMLTLVWLDRVDEAAAIAQNKLVALERPVAHDFLRAASLWARLGQWPRAVAALEAGLDAYPKSDVLLRSLEESRLQQTA